MKKTVVFRIDPLNPDPDKIRVAADYILKGGLVAFPTETVYGLGADAFNPRAIIELFEAKKRPLDNPPIVHVSKVEDLDKLVKNVPSKAKKLMEHFWPGPLTLIFKHSRRVPDVTVAGLDTIAIRMPRHKVALALLAETDRPIAAPSANAAGRPSPTSAAHVLSDLNGKVDVVLDAGSTTIGVESTVLDLTVSPPQILRPGGIPYESLREFLKKVELNPVAVSDKPLSLEKVRSPGLKYRHYAPTAEMVVVEGEHEAVTRRVNELIRFYSRKGKKVGVLGTQENLEYYAADSVKCLGSNRNPSSAAKNLFGLLREFDSEKIDLIIAEGIPLEDLGLAVMNRLRKASGYNIVKAC